MQITERLVVGRSYVLFLRDREVRGRLARKDALALELVDDAGAVRRVARRDVAAVLEPRVPLWSPPARMVS